MTIQCCFQTLWGGYRTTPCDIDRELMCAHISTENMTAHFVLFLHVYQLIVHLYSYYIILFIINTDVIIRCNQSCKNKTSCYHNNCINQRIIITVLPFLSLVAWHVRKTQVQFTQLVMFVILLEKYEKEHLIWMARSRNKGIKYDNQRFASNRERDRKEPKLKISLRLVCQPNFPYETFIRPYRPLSRYQYMHISLLCPCIFVH